MYVKLKATGEYGDIPDDKFDPSLFEQAVDPLVPRMSQSPFQNTNAVVDISQQQVPLMTPKPPEQKGFLKSAADFLAPKLSNVASMSMNTAGMGKDLIEYKTAKTGEEKTKQLIEYNQKRQKVVDSQKEFGFSDTGENQFDAAGYAKGTAQGGLEAASLAVPMGSTIPSAIVGGMASGGMNAASRDDADVGNVLMGMSLGAATGGIFKLGGNALNKGLGSVKKYMSGFDTTATQKITQASPAVDQRFIEARGKTLVDAMKKYIPAGSGYDDIVGTATDRGRGGVLNQRLSAAEEIIQSTADTAGNNVRVGGKEIISAMGNELKNLKSQLGNESKVEALKKIMIQAAQKYKNGITVKQAVKLLREANSKFGKSIIDVNTGDAVVSSAQKLEANTIRRLLKGMFPEIAGALDEQADLLVLQPILNHARSVSNTQGSTIRTSLVNKVDLTKPLASIEAIINEFIAGSPEKASAFLQKGSGKEQLSTKMGMNIAGKAIPPMVEGGQRLTRQIMTSMPSLFNQKSDAYNQAPNDGYDPQATPNSENQIDHDPSIPPNGLGASPQDIQQEAPLGLGSEPPPLNEYGATISELRQLQSMAIMQGATKDASRIGQLIDIEVDAQKEMAVKTKAEKAPKLSEGDKKFAFAKQEAQKALDQLDTLSDIPVGPLQGSKLAQTFRQYSGNQSQNETMFLSKVAVARTAVKNALLGANQSPQEVQSLLEFTFDASLPREILRDRIASFVDSMDSYMQTIAGPDTSMPQYDQTGLGGTPPAL